MVDIVLISAIHLSRVIQRFPESIYTQRQVIIRLETSIRSLLLLDKLLMSSTIASIVFLRIDLQSSISIVRAKIVTLKTLLASM